MPESRQVGGMQEAFLQLRWKSISGVERAVKAVEDAGGRILHAYPPAVLVASVPANKVGALVGKGGIVSVDTDVLPPSQAAMASRELSFAMAVWNLHFDLGRRLRAIGAPALRRAWDFSERRPPDPPEAVLERLRRRELEMAPRAALAPGAPDLSIPVLVGRVAVGLVYVDSTVPEFKITDQQKLKITSETIEGLNMLSGFEPRANVQWFYDVKRPSISLPANQFTPSNEQNWENLWRDAAMKAMGYSASLAGMNAYLSKIKAANNAQWAYALYVTKYPKDWFAYYWGNHVVMDFEVDGWGIDNFNLVVAHETGHAFGCPDEYASSGCNCTQLAGRYRIPNGNCQSCASPFVPCLMAENTPALCDYTRGHLGWNELAVQSKGSTTLKGTWTFDLDTGVQGPPTGADIWWEQVDDVTRFLVPQSGAMLAHMGQPVFDAVSLPTLKAQPYNAAPINGSDNASNQLTPGSVIAVRCASGRYAKIKIDSYGYNLGMTWLTYK